MVTKEETAVILTPKDNLPERLSPDSTIRTSSIDREGNTSIVPEKPSEDGYNWRKYGQKNVKGNEYIRSYYKCSHPNCQVKKQVERSHEGRITDITYLGKHDHIKPHSDPQAAVPSLLSVKVQIPNHSPAAADEDTPADVPAAATDHVKKMDICELAIVKPTDSTTPAPLTPSSLSPASIRPLSVARDDHGENLNLKKRKKGIDGTDSATEKSNHESRVIVHTVSEVDIVNDGYRWRKYGQKMVKGNPNPRSYYRCSTTGCPVKKHVERASHDPKVVITAYEGQHDHSMPPTRTIVPQIAGASAGGTESNDNKSKSEESDPEKSDYVDPTTASKEENNFGIVARVDPISRSTDQEASLAEKTESVPQTVQEEKVPSGELDIVPKTVSTEAKPSVQLNKVPEIVSTESKSLVQLDKVPEIVSAEAKPSVEIANKPEVVLSEEKPSAELDKKPEIAAEAKRPDALVEKSNGLQRPNADAVNC